jgi:hypothetical protein
MTYRKHLNTKEVNQLLEERFFNKNTLKDPIIENKNQVNKKDEKILTAIEKLTKKFGIL